MSSQYFDKRSDFFRKEFTEALSYETYLESASANHREKWRNFETRLSLTSTQASLLQSFKREMNILVLSGVWCGDCARQGPMLKLITDASSKINLRFAENRSRGELQNELRINGAEKVPVIVVLSEDFYELSRYGDRHLSVYRYKAHNEFGPACELGIVAPPRETLIIEIQEWVDFLERLQIMLRLSPALRKRYND